MSLSCQASPVNLSLVRRMTRIGDRVTSVIVMSGKSSDWIIGEEDDQDLLQSH